MKKLYRGDNDYKFTPRIMRAVIEISIFMILLEYLVFGCSNNTNTY